MDLKFKVTASDKSDAELLNCIENREKYLPETIEASVSELQYRGHAFTDDELRVINEDIQAHRENAALGGRRSWNYKNNIVEDPDAPEFYSRRVVYAFAFIFGALFGSIMMAININKTNNPVRMLWVLLFGFAFTIFQIVIVECTGSGSSVGIIFSLVGAIILESFFWNRFIGNDTFYRAKKFWAPLIIGLVMATLIVIATIYGAKA
jgi:hypothetical protein